MSGRVWRSSLLAIAAIALLVAGWMGASHLGYTRAFFSDTVKTSAVFKAGTWVVPPLMAYVDIKPESLQKKSEGEPIMAFIRLPDGFDVRNIDPSSIRLALGADPDPDGLPSTGKPQVNGNRLKVTFDRAKVIALVKDAVPPINVIFSVSGTLATGSGTRTFSGTDVVRLVDPSRQKEPAPEETITPTGTVTAKATVTPSSTATAPSATTVPSEETVAPEGTAPPSATLSDAATPEPWGTNVPEETAVPSETSIPTEAAAPSDTPEGSGTTATATTVPLPTLEGGPQSTPGTPEP